MMDRRYKVHYGLNDGAGYVVTDSLDCPPIPGGWRGKVLFKTDSRSDAEQEAVRLNEEYKNGTN